MSRLLVVTNWKGGIKMFHRFTVFRRKRQSFAGAMVNELMPVSLEMPAGYEEQTVPASTVVSALLWQHYGLDLLHPVVSRWLEQNAPDVKYAVAKNQFESGADRAELKVGSDGTINVYLSPEVDDRLREVSTTYLLRQIQYSKPQKKHRAA